MLCLEFAAYKLLPYVNDLTQRKDALIYRGCLVFVPLKILRGSLAEIYGCC